MNRKTLAAATKRRGLTVALGVLGVVLLVAAGLLAAMPHHADHPGTTAVPDPAHPGQVIYLDTTITPQIAAKQQAVPVYNGLRMTIPAVSFDVPLGAISVADGQLTPPGISSAYWVRNLGVSPEHAADGTIFVVIHTVHGSPDAPGNKLIDARAGHSTLTSGDVITIGNDHYRVTRTATISRTELPTNSEVWTSQPKTLVLITCLEQPDSSVVINNVVTWASLT